MIDKWLQTWKIHIKKYADELRAIRDRKNRKDRKDKAHEKKTHVLTDRVPRCE